MYQGPHKHQHTPAYSNCFCYILLCNCQSVCFMASEDFEELRTSSPTPSGLYIHPSITPSFIVHSTLNQRSAAHISQSCSAGRLTCMLVSLSTPSQPPKFLPWLGLLCVTFGITASMLSSQDSFSDLLTDLIYACTSKECFFRGHNFPCLLSCKA